MFSPFSFEIFGFYVTFLQRRMKNTLGKRVPRVQALLRQKERGFMFISFLQRQEKNEKKRRLRERGAAKFGKLDDNLKFKIMPNFLQSSPP